MGKTVREAMTTGAATASMKDSVADAAQVMEMEDVGSLPVVDDGRLLGVLTDRDIVVRVVAQQIDPTEVAVGTVASRGVVTVEPDQDLGEALALMGQYQVRRLPVVDNGRLVGVLAQADVAIEGTDADVGAMLNDISQPMAE